MRPLLLLSICAFALSYTPNYRKMPDVLPSDSHGKYIIKFKDSPSVVRASSFVKAQAAQVSSTTLASISSAQGIEPDQLTYGITSTYNSTFLNALAVNLSEEDLKKLKKKYKGKIEYIEPDLKYYASGTQQGAPWGVARIGQWNYDQTTNYQYPDAAGAGVDVYVLDSGLIDTHPSFEGRAKFLQNLVPGSSNQDVVGHGTHVAGTVGSSKYGVAKKANIFGIKVLGDQNEGDLSGMIGGIQVATARAKRGKTVINMSLGGPKARFFEDALAAAKNAGALVVVAAGNDSDDACNYSPADSVNALTVGATDWHDNAAHFSNWGSCVKVYAPGARITSLGKGGRDDTDVQDGTSMAAPHVAGIAAVYMSMKSYTNMEDVVNDIKYWSNKCVKGVAPGSTNALTYINAKLK